MGKKWLLTIPLVAIVISIAPFVMNDSWNSACACIPVNETFAYYAGTTRRTLFDGEDAEERVSKGLRKSYPQGRAMTLIREEFKNMYQRAECQSDNVARTWSCNIWLERKDHQERGYAVSFQVSPDDTVIGVSAKRIYRAISST